MFWTLSVVCLWTARVTADGLFHEPSRIVLSPSTPADSFGYSLLVRDTPIPQLMVGAPQAASTHYVHDGLGNTGAIYTCALDLTRYVNNITCDSYEFDTEGNSRSSAGRLSLNHYKNEMWLGAALGHVGNSSLVMCAPRWCNVLETPTSSHRLVNGLCYVTTLNKAGLLVPLADATRQAFNPSGRIGPALNYFAYGQAGFSATVSADDNWLLLGAPGVTQWTGTVAKYRISTAYDGSNRFKKQTISNPYYTDVLHEDSYFGYSVESGVFEPGGETLGVGGAPRGNDGRGQVLLFSLAEEDEDAPLNIKALLTGPQLGSYFGGVLLVADVNADGRSDLLVGAPVYAHITVEQTPYDQGAVYVYLNYPEDPNTGTGFKLQLSATLTGSGASGARFGSAIADLGDINDDSDGYPEIAIGAPWEEDGRGAVYIYSGSRSGLEMKYVQRITSDLTGFGYSIARGLDVDKNGCNDLTIGAVNSRKAALYLCSRSIHVEAEIKLPGALDLPENATDFLTVFCVTLAKTKQRSISGIHPSINVIVSITVDSGGGRASLTEESEYTEQDAQPGISYCKDKLIVIQKQADLTRPIHVAMSVRAAPGFPPEDGKSGPGVRLASDSILQTSIDVQLTRDCGEDFICQPSLQLTVTALNNPFVPGTEQHLGAIIEVRNEGEPAYEACVNVTIPTSLLRVPTNCRIYDSMLSCSLPRPFPRRASINWFLEMTTIQSVTDYEMVIKTAVYGSCWYGNAQADDELIIKVTPEANVTIVGNALPNSSLTISRQALEDRRDFDFSHHFVVTNHGPSDVPALLIKATLPSGVSLVHERSDCERNGSTALSCEWSLPALRDRTFNLVYRMSLADDGDEISKRTEPFQVATRVDIEQYNLCLEVVSTLSVEPASPLWPILVAVALGILLVTVLAGGLYKAGFFGRSYRERLLRLKDDLTTRGGPSADSMQDELVGDADTERELDPFQHSREPSPLVDFYSVQ